MEAGAGAGGAAGGVPAGAELENIATDRVVTLIQESALIAAEANAIIDQRTRASKVARTAAGQISQ